MKIAEIKVSYKSNKTDCVSVTNSKISYEVALKTWDMDLIEFQEEVKVLMLDRANQIIGVFHLSKGGTAGSIIDIKLVLGVALKCHASQIIVVHNHPSGKMKPSESDLNITNKLKKACEFVDIQLFDHLIISKDAYVSFVDCKYL